MANPKETLEQARAALANEDYPGALELYDHFYEHALEIDQGLYGVRLSYCLEEWAGLAKKYPPALLRLQGKMATALILFDKTRDPERFHDYVAICGALDLTGRSVEKFLAYHDADRPLAQSIFRFVRSDLVAARQWEVCGTYLLQPEKIYQSFLEAFDGTMNYGREKAHDETLSFAKDWFVDNMADLLLVLKNTGRDQELEVLQEQMGLDMMSRGMPELADDVDDKVNPPA